MRIPEPGAEAVAEMSFALMLALRRNLLEADRSMRQSRQAKYGLAGYVLKRKTLGIVGVDDTGTPVGEAGVAWGMEAIGCVEHPSPARAVALGELGIRLTDCDEVISTADQVSTHVPLKESTRNLIDAGALTDVKPRPFLINLGRDGVIDEGALYAALTKGGRLHGAALDVHLEEGEGLPSPLAGLPTVFLTPHIGSMTVDMLHQIGRRVVDIVDKFVFEHPELD